jgi:uroporphyrinogen-III decarboxylase
MTSRERVAAAMRHQPPDRVPVMCQLALGHYFLRSNHKPAEIWFDSEVFARTLVEFQQRYRFDGILINLPGRPPSWREGLVREERDGNGWKLHWKNGLQTSIPPDDNPHTFGPNGEPLPRADYATVDPDEAATFRLGGYVWNTWHAPGLWDIPLDADLTDPHSYPDWFTLALRTARSLAPDISIHAEVFSPFTHLLELFSYDQAMMALLDEPDRCHALLDRFVQMADAQVHCLAPHGSDAVLISSAFAGAGFISREMYREFVLPYERRLVEAIHAHRLPAYTHTCGAIGDRLDLMADTGVDGLDTLDPPPLGTVDLAEAKAKFGARLFFKGNLDAVNEMLRAEERTFHDAVLQRLAIGKPGSGYILSSACSVSPHVSPERLKLMTSLAERHGRY